MDTNNICQQNSILQNQNEILPIITRQNDIINETRKELEKNEWKDTGKTNKISEDFLFKTCSQCREDKPFYDFYLTGNRYMSKCKRCVILNRKTEHHTVNIEKIEITKERLEQFYLKEEIPIAKIAKFYSVGIPTIYDYLNKYNILLNRNPKIDFEPGLKFGHLTLICKSSIKDGRCRWVCKCDCGNIKEIRCDALKSKRVKACGKCKIKGFHHPNWRGYGEISNHFFETIKRGALDRDFEFEITIEYIWDLFLKQNRKCVISGVELCFSQNSREKIKTTASLDRIDSKRGYVEGNVQWLHKTVNRMKWDKTDEEFIWWCKTITNHNE